MVIFYGFFRSTPHPVTVTTRIITLLVGNTYKPSFVTVTGWGVDPTDSTIVKHHGFHHHLEAHIFGIVFFFQAYPIREVVFSGSSSPTPTNLTQANMEIIGCPVVRFRDRING